MSLYEKIQALKLGNDVNVNITWKEGCDVHHYTDEYLEEAISKTGIAYTLAEAITEGPLYESGNDILEEMRHAGLLSDYERGDGTFTDFVAEVITESHWDYDWFEYETERYDYKRGYTTFTLDFDVKVSDLKDCPNAFIGWDASVQTVNGTLALGR